MKYKFIYDKNGNIVARTCDEEETEIFSKVVDIPEGKDVVGFNPETKEPIWVNMPKTEVGQMKDQINTLCVALANLIGGM